jgi:hypothetical protein
MYRERDNASITSPDKGEGKVVPLLFLTEHHAMKAYWGSGGIAPHILDLGTRLEVNGQEYS